MKERMVTKFYSANPKNRSESRGAGDFTNHYSLFACVLVAHTEPYESGKSFVTLDFDAKGNVIGIEVVGQQEFSIRELIKQVPVKASDAVLNQTRYIAADLQPA
jgi:hypothetical protein